MIDRLGPTTARTRRATTAVLAAAFAVCGAGTAHAQSGGAYASDPGAIDAVSCRTACEDADAVHAGGTIRIAGRGLSQASEVIFLGAPGNADDVTVGVRRARGRLVDAEVPKGAPSGRVRVRTADGAQSRPSSDTITVLPPEAPPEVRRIKAESTSSAEASEPVELDADSADLDTSDRIDAQVDAATVFYAGFRKATFRYVVTGDAPLDVAVEVVRAGTKVPAARWTSEAVEPGVEQRITWDGTTNGKAAPQGRYEFRIRPVSASAAQDDGGEPAVVEDSFRFLDHKFPVRGRHDYGGSGALFGAGRGGRSHQGHDVFAACGTPLVAARGGVVERVAWQGNAGNYIIIDGDGTDVDYAYMHLQQEAIVGKGERVRTGERIGNVGDTGDAHGCHLHFEMWTGPGWYQGGRPLDPLAALRAWDAHS